MEHGIQRAEGDASLQKEKAFINNTLKMRTKALGTFFF